MADEFLNEEERRALLRVARRQIQSTVGAPTTSADADQPTLPELKAGAFVSLHKKGALRGCIGTFDTTRPVVQQVEDMALAAATRDPRFSPVTGAEEIDIDIEISVLTPPRTIEDIEEIEVGKHGIVITRGFMKGVLLPQVATEYGWDRETFLRHTCRKAGINEDAWRDSETEIQVFAAEVFGEKKGS
jgi:AmmeMemoRadiSam system protein A